MSAPVVVFVVCVVACAVAHGAILVSSVSARSTGDAPVPRPKPLVEFAWALVPILVLALLFTATWSRVHEREHHAPAEAMKVAT